MGTHAPVIVLEGPEPDRAIWVELDDRSAREALARCLAQPTPLEPPWTDLELAALGPGLDAALESTGWRVVDLVPSLRLLMASPVVHRVVSDWAWRDRALRAHACPETLAALPIEDAGLGEIPAWCTTIQVQVRLTGLRASPPEIEALEPGDVLLGLSRRARVHAGSSGLAIYAARLASPLDAASPPTRLELLDRVFGKRTMTNDDEPAPTAPPPDSEPTLLHARAPAPPGPGLMDELTVEIEVELCRAHVPMAAVFDWTPGAVLALDHAPAEPVVLRIGGRRLGRGQLVEIDGRLGVRLMELGGRDP